MTLDRYYFYKCGDPAFAEGYDFFDHAKGIVGFKKKQDRARYMGVGTIEELPNMQGVAKVTKHRLHGGRKRGVPNG